MTEEQVNAWQRECLDNAQKYIADKGILPVSIIAAWQGCKKHKDAHIVICIVSSLLLLVLY